jgi:hypothetical protein
MKNTQVVKSTYKLTNNKIRSYGLILRMKKETMTVKELNIKVKGKHKRGRLIEI